MGEATFNDRQSSVLFAPHFARQSEAILALLARQVVRTPAVVLTTGERKMPFCWSGGWGVALPADQCLREEGASGASIDLPQIAAEIRQPHRDISRRLVEFDWSSHTLRILGLGEFPIARGEAAAVVQRLVEAVWSGEEMVALSALRKAAGADPAKNFKDMMGRTPHWERFIRRPQQGYYALRLIAD